MLGQLWPIGIAVCAINLPFMIWAVTASVNALDPDLENCRRELRRAAGAGFLSVTLPAVMPGVITGSLLMFILALNEFLVSLLLVDARIMTLPVQIYNSIRSIITPDLAAISVVFVVVAASRSRRSTGWSGSTSSSNRNERGGNQMATTPAIFHDTRSSRRNSAPR